LLRGSNTNENTDRQSNNLEARVIHVETARKNPHDAKFREEGKWTLKGKAVLLIDTQQRGKAQNSPPLPREYAISRTQTDWANGTRSAFCGGVPMEHGGVRWEQEILQGEWRQGNDKANRSCK